MRLSHEKPVPVAALLVVAILSLSHAVEAQHPTETRSEVWPEIDVYVPLVTLPKNRAIEK